LLLVPVVGPNGRTAVVSGRPVGATPDPDGVNPVPVIRAFGTVTVSPSGRVDLDGEGARAPAELLVGAPARAELDGSMLPPLRGSLRDRSSFFAVDSGRAVGPFDIVTLSDPAAPLRNGDATGRG